MQVHNTAIEGLRIIELDVHGDNRGWFKENWQREKLGEVAPELASFQPVQNNISYNRTGATRILLILIWSTSTGPPKRAIPESTSTWWSGPSSHARYQKRTSTCLRLPTSPPCHPAKSS